MAIDFMSRSQKKHLTLIYKRRPDIQRTISKSRKLRRLTPDNASFLRKIGFKLKNV